MIILLALALVAAAGELLLYNLPLSRRVRVIWAAVTIFLMIASTTGLLLMRWPIWIGAWVFGWYRVINCLRAVEGRLPAAALRRISSGTFRWLLLAQVGASLIAWYIAASDWHAGLALDVLISLQLLVSLFLVRVSYHTWRHTRPTTRAVATTDKDLPSLSVLIPARNETDDLQTCLQSLVASDYPKLEIIVLDDCSVSRRTPEIIRSFAHAGVRFVQGAVPDEANWLPKNQAYARLRAEASGELLLFCGVDVLVEPQTLRRLVGEMILRNKAMLSVLPLRTISVRTHGSLLQPMRYFWEICLPRRLFKRPPVLSTCWLIRTSELDRIGGFESVQRSVVPEAHFAKQLVVADAYSFLRSDETLGVFSSKPSSEQYATTVRMRYPQLHRRLELVLLTAVIEFTFLVGPILGLCLLGLVERTALFGILWSFVLLLNFATYYLVAVGTRLNSVWLSPLLFPLAVIIDLIMLHISMWKYEFSTVEWKGRNVCIPVMQIEPHLPKS